MKYIRILLIITGTLFYSCEKVVTINAPAYTSKVSIQSMLEPGSVPVVYFSKTVPYLDTATTFAELIIRNAAIKIQSSAGTDYLKLDSVFNPVFCQFNYYYKGNIPVLENKIYKLTITNGKDIYTATCETNQAKVIIDSTGYTPEYTDLYGGHEGVITYFKDIAGTTNYYRFEMERYVDSATEFAGPKLHASCLGKDSVAVDELGRSVYSDQGQDGVQMKLITEPAYTHVEGTTGLVYIQSIDKNAFAFFDQLDKQKLAQYNPFVEPVFLQPGQFGNGAIGYFSSMVKSDPVDFIFPE